MVAGRTVLGVFYSVETMGYYSLANSIANATLLGFKAVSWVVFPDILSKIYDGVSDRAAAKTVQEISDLYSTSVFLTVFGMILLFPLLFSFLPQYKPAEVTLDILLLSQAILSVCFGYNAVAIARKNQLKVAGISIIATAVVAGFSLLVAFLKLPFVWIAVAILAGSFVFTLLQARLGYRTINKGYVQDGYFKSILPLGSFVAVLFSLIGSLSGYTILGGLIGLAIFSIANKGKLELVWDFAFRKARAI
jgi:hypothetical protein